MSKFTQDYEWDSFPAGQEDAVRVRDRQRAAVCCVAVSQEPEFAKTFFAKYSDLNFGKVILAPGLTRHRPRILVATAYEETVVTVYVAFKGSSALEKVFNVADSQFRCHGRDGTSVCMKGHVHNGFYKAVMEELPSPMELMGFCGNLVTSPDSQMDRLIFCGHGLGGALSHMSMLSLQFSLFSSSPKELKESENTFLSIAFGAPLFLDEEARNYFSATGVVPVENRFLTYINDEDPVPLMLNKLIAYPAQPLVQNLHKKLNTKFQTILEVAGKVPILPCTFKGHGGLSRREHPTKLNIPPALRRLEETDTDMKELKAIPWQRGRGYAAFGQFTRLSGPGLQSPVISTELDFWTPSWTQGSVKYHAMGHYAENVLPTEPSQVPAPNFEEGSPPKVDEAFLTIISGKQQGEGNGARLEVVGYNLSLCLKKKCTVLDFADKWEITRVEQNRIVFRNKIKLEKPDVTLLANQMTKVKIETMFGETDYVQVRRKTVGTDSYVMDGLKHVIAKLVIFESVEDWGPKLRLYETLHINLKQHLQVVATKSQSQPSWERFLSSLQHPTKSVFDKRKDADGFIEQVSNHFHQVTLKVKLEPIIGSGEKRRFFVRKGLGGAGFCMFSVGAAFSVYLALAVIVSVSTMGIAIPIAAGGLALGMAALVLSYRNEIKLEDYDQIVKFMYGPLKPGQALLPGDKNVGDYEKAIIEEVKILSVSDPIAWIQQVQEKLTNQAKETKNTVVNLITLMVEIDKAVKIAREQKVLAVVGPENVGKSTLINILRNGVPNEDEDEETDAATTGFTTHTDDPKGYLALAVGIPNLVAVDFPGMGAAHDRRSLSTMWESFERLADVCLVLMKFNGDVTADCSEVPKQVRKKLCDKVVLMVNHVDGVMKGKKTAKVWRLFPPSKVEELRQGFIRNSDNTLDSVMLTCLSTDLYDEEKEMLEERGILFAEDVLMEIKQLLRRSNNSSI